ncbi:MAG: hypothetical protein ACFB0B_03510 [Thermonemataceae bacterium]
MKNAIKLLLIFILASTLLSNCSNENEEGVDPTVVAEDPIEDEVDPIEIEDISTLRSDTEFNEFIDLLVEVSNQVADYSVVRSLNNKPEALTNEEEIQLALAFGFDDLEGMKAAEDLFRQKWESVVFRYGISGVDKAVFAEIFIELYDAKYSEANIKAMRSNTRDDDEFCREERQKCYESYIDLFYGETGKLCFNIDPELGCLGQRDRDLGLGLTDEQIREFLDYIAECDLDYYCCIIDDDDRVCTEDLPPLLSKEFSWSSFKQ